MRILHVYKDYHPVLGGIEGNIEAIAERQAAAGHAVTVLVTNPGGQPADEMRNGVRVVRAARVATVASTPLSPAFAWHLRLLRPDIAHLHFPYPVGEVSQWLVGRRWPYVITYHSDVVKQRQLLRLYGPLLRRVLAGAARIMPTSAAYAASSPFLRPLADRCTPVPLGIDPTPYLNADPLPLDLPTGRPRRQRRLLFVGRHRYYKGVAVLLRALPQVPDAHLLIGGDGPERAAWQALAAELGLVDRVHFLGNVPAADLPRLYTAVDLFVLPAVSRAEAFGIVLMEAMASGLACVTSELQTGTSFIVQDGVTGAVVPPADEAALAAAINGLLDDDARRRAFGAAGRLRVLQSFTIDRMVERIEAVYRDVMATAG